MSEIYKRENYLRKIRGFYHNTEIIKVITGIRRAGKSCILMSIIEELIASGIKNENIIYIKLDSREYRNVQSKDDLDKIISSKIASSENYYLFIDEIQNVEGFEEVIDAYRNDGNVSIFITGSNSYLLSGNLVTKLSGRKIEIEVLPLTFFEYVDMKKFFNKEVNSNIYLEFEAYIRNGGFPGTIMLDNDDDKRRYTKNILDDIFEKDIKTNEKIKNTEMFKEVQNYIINNFGAIVSPSSISKYYEAQNINIDIRTIERYINILENAKIIIPCELFDIKSKRSLSGEKKYYLADLSLYFAFNTDNRINYGPVLENVLHNYLISKDYSLSVGRIGKLECDFIARKNMDNYYYLQVSKNIDDVKTEEREYKPFYEIKDFYPKYLFVLDFTLQKNVNGIHNVNIVDFIYNNEDLI